jgi:SsrA-binding protein
VSSSSTVLIHANKKALFDYEIIESFEAGIVLTGAEVKSVRAGGINLKGSHVSLHSGRPILLGAHISPYKQVFGALTSPVRDRELFLHKKTILLLASKVREK